MAGERRRSCDRAERIIGARRRLDSPEHREIDGEGIQLSVDLDVMLMDAGIRPEDADAMADDEIRIILGSGADVPVSQDETGPGTPRRSWRPDAA